MNYKAIFLGRESEMQQNSINSHKHKIKSTFIAIRSKSCHRGVKFIGQLFLYCCLAHIHSKMMILVLYLWTFSIDKQKRWSTRYCLSVIEDNNVLKWLKYPYYNSRRHPLIHSWNNYKLRRLLKGVQKNRLLRWIAVLLHNSYHKA